MKGILGNPKATLAIVIASCLAIDTALTGIGQAIAPLAHVHGFEALAPHIQATCAILVVASNAAIVLASIGESFVKAIATFQHSVASGDGNAPSGASAGSPSSAEEVQK